MKTKFRIENITTERRINGMSTITASVVCNGEDVLVQTVIPNKELTNKSLIRKQLLLCVKECMSISESTPVKIGDYI